VAVGLGVARLGDDARRSLPDRDGHAATAPDGGAHRCHRRGWPGRTDVGRGGLASPAPSVTECRRVCRCRTRCHHRAANGAVSRQLHRAVPRAGSDPLHRIAVADFLVLQECSIDRCLSGPWRRLCARRGTFEARRDVPALAAASRHRARRRQLSVCRHAGTCRCRREQRADSRGRCRSQRDGTLDGRRAGGYGRVLLDHRVDAGVPVCAHWPPAGGRVRSPAASDRLHDQYPGQPGGQRRISPAQLFVDRAVDMDARRAVAASLVDRQPAAQVRGRPHRLDCGRGRTACRRNHLVSLPEARRPVGDGTANIERRSPRWISRGHLGCLLPGRR